MSLVLDASVTLAWFFESERTHASDAVLVAVTASGAVVPSLWRLEIANALQMAIRRGRIDKLFRDASLTDLQALNIRVDAETDTAAWSETLALADRWELTLYDAAYLELAARLQLPLATLDKALRIAATGHGVQLLGK